MREPDAPPVGMVTEESLRKYARLRAAEQRRAERQNVEIERLGVQAPREPE
jgi:hypothetical protein